MTTNPPVQVGDRIVALEMHGAYQEYASRVGQSAEVKESPCCGTTVHIDVKFDDGIRACVTSWRLADPQPYRPEKGHRVRVVTVYEGEVISEENRLGFSIRSDDRRIRSWSHGPTVSIERLPDPEPKFQPGDVVRNEFGAVMFRTSDKKWVGRSGTKYEAMAGVEHTLLVRDGKPVGGAA